MHLYVETTSCLVTLTTMTIESNMLVLLIVDNISSRKNLHLLTPLITHVISYILTVFFFMMLFDYSIHRNLERNSDDFPNYNILFFAVLHFSFIVSYFW